MNAQEKQILYATDYSPASQQALNYATWLARCTGAKLLIVHVSPLEPYPVGELFDEQPRPSPQELSRLESVVPSDADVRYEHHLLPGEAGSAATVKPAEVIVQFAQQHHVEMIVLGTHGRTGLGHLLLGSVAEAVIRQATCPVVTVNQSGRPARRPAEPEHVEA